ncbi:MAG: hypothetical protein ABSH46_11505 [Bryobacteraceae bacterium]|jgi:hypothetical protein
MNREFAGRDFGKVDVEGYQVRVPREQIAIEPPWTRERLFLNPQCRYALSTSGFLWPCALSSEEEKEVTDPVVGLIAEEKLGLAFYALEAHACEILFLRLIGVHSIRSGVVNLAVPPGFEVCGFDVTNGWWGASPINAQGDNDEGWKELRSIAGGHVNEWSLLDDFAVANQLATVCTERDPREGPFRAVLFATPTMEKRCCLAARSGVIVDG